MVTSPHDQVYSPTLQSCAMAMITLVTNTEDINRQWTDQQMIVQYVKTNVYDHAVMLVFVDSEPTSRHWIGHPRNECHGEGTVTLRVRCMHTTCHNVQTGQQMTTEEARGKMQLRDDKRHKRDLEKLKTATWDTNMFMQWMKYSAQAVYVAMRLTKQNCITCYNARRIPQLKVLPGSRIGECSDPFKCFSKCTLYMASGMYASWNGDPSICPRALTQSDLEVTSVVPPVVQRPDDLIFPFCIARGDELEIITRTSTPNMTDARQLVWCYRHTYTITTADGGKIPAAIKICKSNINTRLKCAQVIPDGGCIIYQMNKGFVKSYCIPKLGGTLALGDIFWTCNGNATLLAQLPMDWEGICAPLMLTGQLSVITQRPSRPPREKPTRSPKVIKVQGAKKQGKGLALNGTRTRSRSSRSRFRRDLKEDGTWDWQYSGEVYISWDQVPYGMPDDYAAVNPTWIKTGRLAGASPFIGPIFNAQYIARNTRWINLLWFNQQRFINYTIRGFSLIREQLHATSIMALQNRFVVESLMAPQQGVCEEIGEECCTEIPLHTAAGGNLTRLLQEMRRMRDEHVRNSNWNTQLTSFGDWFWKGGWLEGLKKIGIAIGLLLLLVMVVVCCVIPLLRLMIFTVFKKVTGQFPLIHVQHADQVIQQTFEDETADWTPYEEMQPLPLVTLPSP